MGHDNWGTNRASHWGLQQRPVLFLAGPELAQILDTIGRTQELNLLDPALISKVVRLSDRAGDVGQKLIEPLLGHSLTEVVAVLATPCNRRLH